MFAIAHRYRGLLVNRPPCPKCGSGDVKVREYLAHYPALWNCETCEHEFEYEPDWTRFSRRPRHGKS